MAKRKEMEAAGPRPGTVEYERQQFFEREKAAYEERTGETVAYELDTPLTSTPIGEQAAASDQQSAETAEAEGEG